MITITNVTTHDPAMSCGLEKLPSFENGRVSGSMLARGMVTRSQSMSVFVKVGDPKIT